jgi:SAM-dependent methyltransferase
MDDNIVEKENPSGPATPPASEYNADYYDTYGRLGPDVYTRNNPHWLRFFGRVADEIVRLIHPQTVLDVGCAKGFLVESLRDRGVEAYGFDVSEYAIREIRPDISQYCWVGSATGGINKNYDLITCIEVCEHLSESDALNAIRQMISHTDTILFSSTPSDFTEATHVNVRPIIDWLRAFAQFSFAPDQEFEPGFLAPQALLFRRVNICPSDQNLCRYAQARNRAIIMSELENSGDLSPLQLQKELNTIINSKGWKLLSVYRDLRFRVKHALAQALRKLNLIR